jgi:hypothetical protein
MKPKFILLLVTILAISASAFGQQRWFENGPNTGSFKRLQWENVAIVIFYNPANPASSTGAHIFTFADGKFEDWGIVPKNSQSLRILLTLINGSNARWLKIQPHQKGSYLRPDQAVAYADFKTIVSYTKVFPIEFGQEVYAITFENFNGKGAVVDAAEKARVDKLISDSQNP